MRRPKKCASIENAPGPSKGITADTVSITTNPKVVFTKGLLHASGFKMTSARITSPVIEDAKGVKKPTMMHNPEIIPIRLKNAAL